MQKVIGRLTVYYEDPFWVGVYERSQDGRLEVCKITFGAQPRDQQVYEYLLQNWHRLCFSPPVRQESAAADRKNPKRIQREIARQLSGCGVGTRSQQALQLQREEGRTARRQRTRQQREEKARQQFLLRQQKKKQRKRGH